MPSRTASPLVAVARERLDRDRAAHAHAALVAQVRQDAQAHVPPRELGEAIGHGLGDGVDEVRAHRVAAVDEEVHDHHAVAEIAHLEAARAAAAAHEVRHRRIGQRAAARPSCASTIAQRGRGVRHVVELHLAIITGSSASATKPPPARIMRAALRGRGHDGRLLDHHRHQVVAGRSSRR